MKHEAIFEEIACPAGPALQSFSALKDDREPWRAA